MDSLSLAKDDSTNSTDPINDKLEKYFNILEGTWDYYFSSLEIEPYEYDIYNKIIDRIRNKDYDFTEDYVNNILKIMSILQLRCDEYEIRVFEEIKKIIKPKY